MAKKKLVVIDGHAMAYRAHYAMAAQGLTDTSGMPTGAIFGFFRMVLKLLNDTRPEYFLIVFDPPGKSFRSDIFSDYKANRSAMPDELRSQLDEIKAIIRALKLPLYIPEGVEADDALASIAEQYQEKDVQVYLVSGDKDLFNVLYKNVKLLRPKKGVSEFIEIDKKYVKDTLGLDISQVPDYMALTGDSSDNIPGVKGIGEKTATRLISEYKSLEKLYQQVDKVTPAGVQKKLQSGAQEAQLSYKLVTLIKDLDLGFKLADLEFKKLRSLGQDIQIFRDKDFAGLYSDWLKFLGPRADLTPAEEGILKNFTIIKSKNEFDQFIAAFDDKKILSFDCETNSPRPTEADLVGLSLAFETDDSGIQSAYIPACFDQGNDRHFDYADLPPAAEMLGWVKPLLENKKIKKIGQNLKFDWMVLLNHGVEITSLAYDTMIMSYMLNPNQRRHGLDDLAERLLGHDMVKYKDLVGTGKKQKPLVSIGLEAVGRYGCEDAEVALRIFRKLLDDFQESKNEQLYDKIDHPLVYVILRMEQNGILVDVPYLKELEKKYQKTITGLEKKVYKEAGEEFNINSTKELQRVLFEKLKIESTKKTAKGARSTEHSVLVTLRNQHNIIDLILDHRTYSKLMSTYITPLPDYINKKTGRVHTSFSQVTAATGRLASTDPNMQNIPIKGEDGRLIRRAFVAEEGFSLLSLDYSQIELRILAHYSEDENLVRAYREEEDIHDQAVYLLFQHQFNPKTKQWKDNISLEGTLSYDIDKKLLQEMKTTSQYNQKRSQAKVLNFSIAYGVTEWGLAQNLGISPKEAKQLIELYFLSFPGIKKFMDDIIAETRKKKYSENLFGRRRRITEIDNKNRFAREAAERLAINTPIQSTAADIIKLAMIKVQEQLDKNKYKSRLLLQIHDELVLEVADDEKDQVYAMVKKEMENVTRLKVPLVVDGGFAQNWQEAR